MRFNSGKTEKHNIKIMMCKDYCVNLCFWCYCVFHEVKQVEKMREHIEGVMDENGHCAGFIST